MNRAWKQWEWYLWNNSIAKALLSVLSNMFVAVMIAWFVMREIAARTRKQSAQGRMCREEAMELDYCSVVQILDMTARLGTGSTASFSNLVAARTRACCVVAGCHPRATNHPWSTTTILARGCWKNGMSVIPATLLKRISKQTETKQNETNFKPFHPEHLPKS